MAKQIQEVFWLTSADYQQLLYVSPAFETVWGYPRERLYSHPGGHLNLIVDSIHPSDKEAALAALSQKVHDEYKAEYRIIRPDGAIRWVRSRSFIVQNSFGETWGIAGLSEDITEHKQSEELLRKREQEFTALVENSPDIISRFDRELRHIYVNPAVELATGMPSQEFLGKTHQDLGMSQALLSLWQESLQKVFQTGEPDEHEFRYLTPSGWKYYQSRLFPELAADGSVESVLGICRDLTKNKQTEEALRESEECFRNVFDFAPMGMATCNLQGRLLQTNQAFQEILGYTNAELQNQPFTGLTHPDDQAQILKLFEELLTGKRHHFSLEKRYIRKDGNLVWGNVSVSAIYDADGLFQYAIAMLQDISDAYRQAEQRKQAESERQKAHDQLEKQVAERTALLQQANTLLLQEITEHKQAQKELKAQKDFLQTVLDTNPNLIWVKDREDRIVLANQALADFFGLTVEDLMGKTNPELHTNPADAEICIAQDKQVIATLQEKFIPEEAFPTRLGEMRWFQTIKKPIFSSQGQVCQVLGVSTDITERKLLTEELKAQKEFLQTVLDTNPNRIFVKDTEGKYLLVNQACADFWEITVEDMLGKTDAELNFYQANIEQFGAWDQEVLTTLQQQFYPEVACYRPNGEVRWFQTIKKPLFSSDGQVSQIFGVCADITERKLAQEALRLSEMRFRLAFDNIPDVFVIYDAQRRFQFVNAQGIRISGKSLEEHLGHTDEEIWPNEVTADYLPILKRAVETRTIQTRECNIAVPNTGMSTFIVSYVPVLDERGEIYQFLGITHDITQRKQAEEQLRQSEEQLRQSEEQLRLALDAAHMGFWDWNFQTGEITRSPHLERLFGWTPNSGEKTSEAFMAILHPDDRDRLLQAEQHCLETGEDYNIEFRVIWPDGSLHWIEAKGQTIHDEIGKPIRMTGIDVDITERKQTETKIKESLQEKEVLLQEIHHRVKNNLQVICSLLDLQSQHLEDQGIVEVFRESCNRVRSMALVHEQLYQSKNCARINCVEYIESLTSYLFRVYGVNADKITLELDLDEITLNINTAIPCGLIISELVSNALKYAFPNATEGTIKVALHSPGNHHFTLIVRDNGIGFSTPWDFKSVKSLGLQLVKVLTSQLEGTLELDHSVGTEFRIEFLELSF
jgi:PAS domain S-box-containing protein